jgi:hypothetical protein
MHAVIRRYVASPEVVAEARPKLDHLAQTMRRTPGFVAYYFLQTRDGLATITVTEDESGASESIERAAEWVRQNLQTRAALNAPEVTLGEILMNTTRAESQREDTAERRQTLAERYASRLPTDAVQGGGTTACPSGYPVKGNTESGLYHVPESSAYAQTIPEFCFASASAAESAGFHAPG